MSTRKYVRKSKEVKEAIVARIVELTKGKSKVSNAIINKVTKEFAPLGVNGKNVRYYWTTTMEKGKPTRRGFDDSIGAVKGRRNKPSEMTARAEKIPHREIDDKEACAFLLTVLLSREAVGYNCINFNISYNQYSEMIHRLGVTGKVGNKRILNPGEYFKGFKIQDMFRYSRRPDTRASKKIDSMTKTHYAHVIHVLIQYLGKAAGLDAKKISAIQALDVTERSKKFSLVI